MSTDNKYFTPSIEDIHIGYECEISTMSRGLAVMDLAYPEADLNMIVPFKQVFEPALCTDHPMGHSVDNIVMMLKENRVRVPYLTKEQIEADGWGDVIYTEGSISGHRYGFSKGNYFMIWEPKLNTVDFIFRDPSKASDELGVRNPERFRFFCACKDINTLRTICKLLGI